MKDCKLIKEKLVDFIEQQLDDELTERIRKHIKTCAPCRELVEQFSAVWSSTDEFDEIELSPCFHTRLEAKLNDQLIEESSEPIWKRIIPTLQPAIITVALLLTVFAGYKFADGTVADDEYELTDNLADYGLDNFGDIPGGSFADMYFDMTSGNEGDDES